MGIFLVLRIATASVRTGFAMTWFFARGAVGRADVGIGPYGGVQGVWEKNPPVTALPCQPPLGKGAEGTGDADCHSRCAHRLRNDRVFTRGAMGGGTHGSRPTHFMGRGGDTGRCRHRPLQPYVRATKKGRREAVFFLHISITIICAFSLRHGAGRTLPAPPPGSPARPGPGRYRTRPSPQG